MSIKDRLAAKSAAIGQNKREPKEEQAQVPGRPKTAPGQMMAAIPFLAEKERELEAKEHENAKLRERLRNVEENATVLELPLAELQEIPGRRRRLTAEQYHELKENLRLNPLVQAVTVRKQENGYEIISGHNRVAAYRELGRKSIPAIILKDADDVVSEASALYANLFQSDLSDYEKYLGFKKLLSITGKTQREIAADSGADEKSVSRWLSFDDLPPEALRIIESAPDKIGGSAVMALAAIAKEGKSEAVVGAIKAIVEGKTTQEAGVRLAREGLTEPKANVRPQAIAIRAGKAVYCKVTGAKETLRLQFKSEEERLMAEEAIKRVLLELANQSK